MTRLEEIVEAIKGLPPEQFSKLRWWINQAPNADVSSAFR